MTSGVRGYLNKLKNRDKNGEEVYRSARSTLGKRINKKLTEKTTWYRKRRESENEKEQNFVGLNANGLPDEPIRKRKRSEGSEAQHRHPHVGGDTMAHQPEAHPPHGQDGTHHGSKASKELGKIKKIKTGKVEKKKKKKPLEIKLFLFPKLPTACLPRC